MPAAFKHPGLQRAAEDLKTLQKASSMIGSADPVAALRWLDCEPPAIRKKAKRVHDGGDKAADARTETKQVSQQLHDSGAWTGEGAAQFIEFISIICGLHDKIVNRCTDTRDAGHSIAERIDGEAHAAANDSLRIAQGTGTAPDIVISEDKDHPRYLDSKMEVNEACREIVSMVKKKMGDIAETRKELRGLTGN